MRKAAFTNTLSPLRQLPTSSRWPGSYLCSRCLNTASKPALFRETEDGREEPIKEHGLYQYQRHRWLRNDNRERDIRARPFNLGVLIERVLNAKGKRPSDKKCVKILKLLEGDHNKVFLLTMNDGEELIAKLSNPNAGINYYTTVSEISTRRFLQRTCNVPMPKIWGWDSDPNNPVGAEWIIEAKADGQPLRKFWSTMSRQAQLEIIQQVVEIETELASLQFSTHGSICLTGLLASHKRFHVRLDSKNVKNNRDDKSSLHERFIEQYAIGPSADRRLYRGPGDFSNQYRGPFKNLLNYTNSLASNERKYIKNNIWERMNFFRSSSHTQGPSRYWELITKYFDSQKHMIPEDINNDPCTISHPNLSLDHIFIDPETNKIACLTGWQSTAITPPILKRPYPRFLDPEFQTQSANRTNPSHLYRELVEKTDPIRFERIFRDPTKYNILIGPMASMFGAWDKDDFFSLRESLLAIRRMKENDSKEPLPDWLQFSANDLQAQAKEKLARQELDLLFTMVQDDLKIPLDGRVRSEDFERAKELSRIYRRRYIATAEDDKDRALMYERLWPFDVNDGTDSTPSHPLKSQVQDGSENERVPLGPGQGLGSTFRIKKQASDLNTFRKIYVD